MRQRRAFDAFVERDRSRSFGRVLNFMKTSLTNYKKTNPNAGGGGDTAEIFFGVAEVMPAGCALS
jgi:hypothetical protein